MFDFDIRHVKGSENGAADGLSQRGKSENDESDSDPNDYFESRLYNITAGLLSWQLYDRYEVYRVAFDPAQYDRDDLVLGKYLTTLERLEGMSDGDYAQLRKKARNFMVRDGLLFKRSRGGRVPPRRVVGKLEEREKIMTETHGLGHAG